MRLGLGLSLTARLMGSGANGAPLEIDGAAWLLEQVDGDPDAIGITWLGPLPDDNGTAITTVRRQRYALGTLWPEYHLKTGGGIPTVNQRYVSYADPGVVNDFWLYAQNGVGTARKGTAKSITPWVALGAPAAFASTEWSISSVPGTVDVADILITDHPNNPQGDLTGTFIDVNDGSGYGSPVDVSSIAIGVPYRITLGAGTFDVRIWDENGQTPVNKSTPKLVTPWVDTDEPPVEVTPPTIAPASGPAGTVFTLTYGTFSGSPDPTLTPTLLLGATDVTASIVTTSGVHTYTSATAGTLSLTVDATNTEGSIDSTTVAATVTAVGPTTLDLGGGYSLSDATGIIYEADPVNGYAVQYKATTSLLHSNKGGTVAAANVDVRNGAMFAPRAGIAGYDANPPLGFDGRMVGNGSSIVYSNATNISPQRTNADFTIPSVGALVIATSSSATIPINYTAQRSNRTVQSYQVVSFMSGAPTAGRFRPPVRGNITPRSNWTAAQVASRLDTIFPRDLTGFEGQTDLTAADVPILIAKLREQPSSWTLGFAMACYSPQRGTSGYGRDRTYEFGCAMLMMRSSNTSYITDAQRLELALGLVRHGLEWWGTVVDGGYFQLNGAATQGAMWAVLGTGLLLDDAYIMNSVLNPISAESNPGLTLGYYPFTEQRNYMAVEAAARTTGSPEGVNWGNYVGSGGSSSGDAAFPDSHPLDTAMIGIPEWCISSDLNSASSNSFHLVQKYRTPNLEGLCAAVGALHDKIGTTHGGYNLAPLQVIADYIDRMSWCEDAIRTAKAAGMSAADAARFKPDGSSWNALIPTTERTVYNACVTNADRYVGKPERPFAPAVSVSGQDVTVTFHPIKAPHGEAITSQKIYWTDDDWATSNTISGISGAATSHTFTATATSTIQVRHAIVTAQGESPASPNQHNRQAANAGAGTGLQGTILTGSNAVTYAATIDALAQPLIFFDSGSALGANAADIPLSGATDAPNGSTIEVRLVRSDTLAEVYPWQAVTTASGGTWSGSYLTASRTPYRLMAEARVSGSSATPARTAREIKIGHIALLKGQSEDHRMVMDAFSNATYQTKPTLPTLTSPAGADADDSVFLMQWSEGSGSFAANGIQVVNASTVVGTATTGESGVTRAMLHMADVLTRNAPGENFLFIAALKSGTSMTGLVDDTDDSPTGDDRAWAQTFGDALTYIRAWGADVGVVMSTWTAAPSTIAGGFRVGHYPIFSGLYADTAIGVAYPAYGANTSATYSTAVYKLDHGFWDLSGLNRPQAAFDAAVTKMAFHGPHRFEDASQGIGKFATTTSGVVSATMDVQNNAGMDLGSSTPVRFWTQGSGLASTETIVIEGSANGSTGWTTVATQDGSTSAHFMVVPATAYRYYRATITKTGGGSVTANVYATGVAGVNTNKQDCRNYIRAMVADPVLAPIMVAKGPEILTYQNGFPCATVGGSTYEPNPANWVDWRDYAHPSQYGDDGLPARARHTGVAMLYAFGVGPAPAVRQDVPKFNRSYWDPDGDFVQFWYEDETGVFPRISTTRRERSEAAIPAAYPHRTEVAGWYRNNVACTDVVIATGVTTSTDVVQINADGNPFDYTDVLNFGLGGASGIVQWPDDEYDALWKNLPIAVLADIVGVDGIAMEPLPSSATLANPLPAPDVFAMSNASNSPRFTDTATIGTASALTLRWKGKITSLAGETLFSMNGTMFSVKRRSSGASTTRKIEILVRDANAASIIANGNTGITLSDDQVVDMVVSFSLVTGNRIVKLFMDGAEVWSSALTGTAQNWSTNRYISVFQISSSDVPDGETEIVEIWKAYSSDGDTSALGTPHKRIEAGTGGTIVETPSSPAWLI